MNNWYQPKATEVGYWQRYIEDHGTSTSCILPWMHLATKSGGDMQLCSASSNKNSLNFVSPMDGWNSEYTKSARTAMMQNTIPVGCQGCFDKEAAGLASKRILETATWATRGYSTIDFIKETRADGSVPTKIYYINFCHENDNNRQHSNPDFWMQINKQIPNLRSVYFTGDEPLSINEYRQFIEEIVRCGFAEKIVLSYETSGLLIDNNLIELWKHFKRVDVNIRIDATGARNNYMKSPSNWETVERMLKMLDTTPDNIEPSISTAIQIFNIKHLPDFVHWKLSRNFKKIGTSIFTKRQTGGLVNMHLLDIPEYLSIQILPKDDKNKINKTFMQFKSHLYNWHSTSDDFWIKHPGGWKRWEDILRHMNAADQSHLLPNFKDYVTNLDSINGLDAKSVFPELAHLL
jgi:hypothetical protein